MADAFTGPFDGYVLWLATEGRPKARPLSGTTATTCARRAPTRSRAA
jgi:hypothetical protein